MFFINISKNLNHFLFRKVSIFHWQLSVFAVICILLGFFLGSYAVLYQIFPKVRALGEINQTWNFSTPADYTLSDSSLIEISGSKTQLKVRNYVNDGNTALLFHLDENSGTSLTDSSSNANTGTAVSSSWITGNFNSGISLNGSSSYLTVPDSASLSFSQAHTIEAWTKFNSSFSAGSHSTPQPIVDKGNYKLYYDQTTGKINYELARSGATTWSQVAGSDWINGLYSKGLNNSWDQNGKPFINASAVIGTDLYVGLGNTVGDAEVWKWNGSAWSVIGGNGVNSSWTEGNATPATQYEQVYSMTTDGTNLFVGLGLTAGDGEVWKYNGSTWTRIGGDATGSGGQSWLSNTYEQVTALASDGTNLFVGLGNTATDAEVWTCAISSCTTTSGWTKIGGDGTTVPPQSWGTSYEAVYSMAISGTTLLVSLGNTAGDAELWSCTIGSCTVTTGWTKRGGDGSGTPPQSWASVQEIIPQMAVSGTKVYLGLGNTGNEGEVWMCDLGVACTTTTGWSKVGGGGTGSAGQSWTTGYEQVTSMIFNGTTLYVGLGLSSADSEIWKCDTSGTCDVTTGWTKIGGDGTGTPPQSWGTPGVPATTTVQRMEFIGNVLYAGLSDSTGAISAMVWSCDVSVACTITTGWSNIGGNYINRSWPISGHQSIESMTVHSGKLYAGMGVTNARNALVWEWNGSTWTLIGGQGLNSSWTPFKYETVQSMVSYQGNLYVGLGVTAGDAEVWKWNGSAWSQVGGDASGVSPQSWSTAGNYEIVNSMEIFNNELYVGLGNTAQDAEVWKCTGTCTQTTGWTKVGGDASGVFPQSWATAGNYEIVYSMTVFNGELYVGLGSTAGDAEVWKCTGTCTQTTGWTKVGGDASGVAPQSWATAGNYEAVESLQVYNGSLYVGLGNTVGDAEVWKCSESCTTTTGWTMVGGDGVSSSWLDGVYERVRSLMVYNGELYAGLGINDGDGEVWKYNGSTWVRVAGDGVNSGWTTSPTAIDNVPSLVVYQGKLYAGTGGAAGTAATNTEATVWSLGNNAILSSVATSQDTSWHHIAATYDGATMKIYIDGVLDNSAAQSLTLTDSPNDLLIGVNQGAGYEGEQRGFFNGYLDEIRLSNTARSSFITTPFTNTAQTVRLTNRVYTTGVKAWDSWASSETTNGGSITYRFSVDNGVTWKFWNGSAWATSNSLTDSNSQAAASTNIPTLTANSGGLIWQAILTGNGNQQVTLNTTTLVATEDVTDPVNPNSLTALDQNGGIIPLTTNTWYNYPTPYFSWSGATDTGGSGVDGYYVYFGTTPSDDPETAGVFQTSSVLTTPALTTNSTYYLRIKTKDIAGNISATSDLFTYKYDGSVPNNPLSLSVLPSGYSSTNNFTFIWSADANDSGGAGSGVAGYQYSVNSTSNWSATILVGTEQVTLNSVANEGANVFYLRTIDNVGNPTTVYKQVNFFFAGSAPNPPQNVVATPSSNTNNLFAFSWVAPDVFAGSANDIQYCYTINTLPSAQTCTFTPAGITSLGASAFANQPGVNTFYVVAKDFIGNINYNAYGSVSFTANTAAPGIPINLEIADVSVKSTSSWKIAVSWEAPVSGGNGLTYHVYRSTDNVTFTKQSEVSGIAHIDTGLSQQTYYYKIKACDSTNNCGAFSSIVSLYPDGRFVTPAELVSGPEVTGVTTKYATINWVTGRVSDSKIAYGVEPGIYFDNEPSNSEQKTSHSIKLVSLAPNTRYYFVTKWTDEDGNTGQSPEGTFLTEPAPTITDPKIVSFNLSTATVKFTSKGASKVRIYYGESASFGFVEEVPTVTEESTYTVILDNLKDGTKYFYKINTFDADNSEYEGNSLTFTTLPRPKISNVRVQQVLGTAQPTALITWETNTETNSIVTYTIRGGSSRDEVNVAFTKTHRIIVRALTPDTDYNFVARGRDRNGNEASSTPQLITTATDTRAPAVSNLQIESTDIPSSAGGTEGSTSQLIITWDTDEASTSQVEYDAGTGPSYSQRIQEDRTMTFNHSVVISGLKPSSVYHLRVISSDKAGNKGVSADTVTITPKGSDNALDLVINNLSQIFSFIRR
jgi:hypothetical protein